MNKLLVVALAALASVAACETGGVAVTSRQEALEAAPAEAVAADAVDVGGAAPQREPGALAAAWAIRTPGDGPAVVADIDGDGFPGEDDPDDENPFVYPGAPEIQCNDVDEDGDGADTCPPDEDGDGVRADLDCDDLDPARSPLLGDIACNGRDEDCNGHDDCDTDHDGAMDWYDLDPDDPLVSVPDHPEEVDHASP